MPSGSTTGRNKNKATEQKYLSSLQSDLAKDTVSLMGIIENIDTLLYSIEKILRSELYDANEFLNLLNEYAYGLLLQDLQPYYDNYDIRRGKVINREIYNDPIFDSNLLRYRTNLDNRQKLINAAMEKHRTLQRLIRSELEDRY